MIPKHPVQLRQKKQNYIRWKKYKAQLQLQHTPAGKSPKFIFITFSKHHFLSNSLDSNMFFSHYRGAMLEVGIQGRTQQIHDHEIVFTLRANPSWVSWRLGVLVEHHRVFFLLREIRNKHTQRSWETTRKKGRQSNASCSLLAGTMSPLISACFF